MIVLDQAFIPIYSCFNFGLSPVYYFILFYLFHLGLPKTDFFVFKQGEHRRENQALKTNGGGSVWVWTRGYRINNLSAAQYVYPDLLWLSAQASSGTDLVSTVP